MQVAFAVADAGDGGDDGGGSGAEGFGKLSGGVSGENFVDGDLALFGRNADLAKQSQSGVACDAGKDRARERRSNRFAIENEEYVHHAGLFDIAALDSVQPQDIVIALFLGEPRGEKPTGVIAGGFAVTCSAGEGADEALFGEQANGLREVGADDKS